MNLRDIHPGRYYKIKDYDWPPSSWNQDGEMNRYFGKTVKIKAVNGTIEIVQDKGDYRTWYFNSGDFIQEINNINLEDDLFEI